MRETIPDQKQNRKVVENRWRRLGSCQPHPSRKKQRRGEGGAPSLISPQVGKASGKLRG